MNSFYYHPDGIRLVDVGFSDTDINILTNSWKDYVKQIPTYPAVYEGKGIVICAGGVNYFTCVWVLINILRKEKGCTLPIQIWYVGEEMTQNVIGAMKDLNVTCHNFLDYEKKIALKKWILKPLAILLSSFKEVLYLDADNVSTMCPEYLFDFAEYKKTGAMFWPDFWETGQENAIWKIIECAPMRMKEQESGQLLIDKEKCWKELNLAIYFNIHSDIYHELLLGDKDTFRFAWLALKTNFYFINHDVGSCGYLDTDNIFKGHTMVQHNPDGQICFLHRNFLKWNLSFSTKPSWKIIQRFKSSSKTKKYFITQSRSGHPSINLQGDLEILDFVSLFNDFEEKCLNYLIELRRSEFYQEFIKNLNRQPPYI